MTKKNYLTEGLNSSSLGVDKEETHGLPYWHHSIEHLLSMMMTTTTLQPGNRVAAVPGYLWLK